VTDDSETNPIKQSSSLAEQAVIDSEQAPRLRIPQNADASAIHQLIRQCPPLDLNSVYAYLLLTEHHGRTCIVAELGDQIVGFVSAYIPPEKPDVLFVWQVAVHECARGQGLGNKMLSALLARVSDKNIRFVETTVGPSNAASRRMFTRLANDLDSAISESILFEPELFGSDEHEEECLLRIGPIGLAPP